MDERYIATADLGTTKIGLGVTRVEGDRADVIYYAETPSEGIRHSCIFNPGKASGRLKEAVEKAEDELGIKILQLVVGLPRWAVRQETKSATITRQDPDTCITQGEIDVLKSKALDSYPIEDEMNEEIYGAVAQSFNTDDSICQTEDDVVGSPSTILEGNFKIFIGARKAVNNVDRMLNLAGIASARKYFLPGAVAETTLTAEEKENGVALIELGGGVTSLTIYQKNLLRYYASIPFGGENITDDIKYECSFRKSLAENIKLAYGACMPESLLNMSEKIIQVNYDEEGTNRQVGVKYLSEIITARQREIFDAILFLLQDSGYAGKLRGGIVLTGGGASLLNSCKYLNRISGYTVRMGFPRSKGISTDPCPAITEPSAAATIAMISLAKKDSGINCTTEYIPEIHKEEEEETAPAVTEDAADTEQSLSGTVFENVDTLSEFVNKPRRKPGKTQKFNFTWTQGFKMGIERIADVTVGSLFDDLK